MSLVGTEAAHWPSVVLQSSDEMRGEWQTNGRQQNLPDGYIFLPTIFLSFITLQLPDLADFFSTCE
jgi:hypothetical protein